MGEIRLSKREIEHRSFCLWFVFTVIYSKSKSLIYSGRAFSLFGETGAANGANIPKKKSTIGVKASAAEAGKYTREAGVLAYYEVLIVRY